MSSGLLDITNPPIRSIHGTGCGCFECVQDYTTVPLQAANSEDFGRFILGRASNETELPSASLREYALAFLKQAREEAPETPGEPCAVWERQGHKGHHWYLLSNRVTFTCACGKVYCSE